VGSGDSRGRGSNDERENRPSRREAREGRSGGGTAVHYRVQPALRLGVLASWCRGASQAEQHGQH
jgi:hypothetical protein